MRGGGTFGANGEEVRGGTCGFPAAGYNKKGKAAEGQVVAAGGKKKVLQGARTQPLQTYVDRRQTTVAEWVNLRPIFDVCVRETGYEGP